MKTNHIAFVIAVAAIACSAPTQADEHEDDLLSLYSEDELISIATGTEKQIRFAPAVASVLTAQDIARSGARTLDEALEMVPGLHVSASFNRQDAIYSIRGIHTGQNPQVLLLIDGVRMQQVFSGARPYNYEMPVNNIERIEVIRGPGSALHGADAFAGVISVTTKSANGHDKTVMGGKAGSFDYYEGFFQTHSNWAGIDVQFAIDYVEKRGDTDRRVNKDSLSQLPPGANPGASLAPGPLETNIEHWNMRTNLSATHWALDLFAWQLVDAGLGSGGAQALDSVGRDESDYYGATFKIKPYQLSENVTVEGRLGATVYDLDSEFVLFPPGASVDIDPDPGNFVWSAPFAEGVLGNPSGREKTYFGEAVFALDSVENHSIRLGAGFQYTDFFAAESKNFALSNFISNDFALKSVTGTPEAYIQDVNREHYYLFLQDEWAIANDWQATLGLRYDKFTQFGETFNPRAALVWATSYNLTTKFLYGRAFRAPSFSELYTENNPALDGNENLDPETIDTYEIAFDYRYSATLGAKLNLFYYEIEDLVEIIFDEEATNSLSQTGQGFEIEFDWDITGDVSLIGNYAWQKAEDDETNIDVPSAPQQQAYLNANFEIGSNTNVSTIVNWVADRERPANDMRSDIDDFITVDAVFRRNKVLDAIDVSIVAKNIFDEDVREPSVGAIPAFPEIPEDYPMEGRSFSIEASYSFD